MVRWALAIVAIAACQGGGGEPGTGTGAEGGTATDGRDAGGSFGTRDAGEARSATEDAAHEKPEEPEAPDPGKVIAELGAITAWQAVVDRASYLARRNQRGIAYGRIGPAILVPGPTPPPSDAGTAPIDAGLVPSPYVWLVDDTDGHGALGIRVELAGHKAKEGDRVALGGAWRVDADRQWYWKVDALHPLPAGPPNDLTDPPAPFPSHEIVQGRLPPGARPVTLAKGHDLIYFQTVGPPPLRDGDGWMIANRLGDKPFARLTLPGERPSYGGQDMRTPDERWVLQRGKTYWVRIGRIRTYGPDKPVAMNARTAPVRVN